MKYGFCKKLECENLDLFCRNSASSVHTVLCCCIQILADHATVNDWKMRSTMLKRLFPQVLQTVCECFVYWFEELFVEKKQHFLQLEK